MLDKLKGWVQGGWALLMILALLIGLLSIVLGGQSVFGMLGGGAPNTPGIWMLIFMAFMSGGLYQSYTDVTNAHKTTHVVDTKEGGVRTGIALAIFFISIILGTDFLAVWSMTWSEFMQALPNSLLAVGAYVVIIQAPWSAYEMSEAQKRAHPKKYFTHYYLETRRNDSDTWVRSSSEPQTHEHAIAQMWETHNFNPHMQTRVIKESISNEVCASPDEIFGHPSLHGSR